MNLYVYRINEREYGVGTSLHECAKRGKIVETWPLNNVEQAKFLAHHGTNYFGASDKVSKLADLFTEVMLLDPDFAKEDDVPIESAIVWTPIAEKPPGLLTRICHAIKNAYSRSR